VRIDISDFMPFNMGGYLVMWFVTGGVIMGCVWIGELIERKQGPLLLGVAGGLLYAWHYIAIQGMRLPFFD
jgi:hypothetical protein